jgi:hypothetical protein
MATARDMPFCDVCAHLGLADAHVENLMRIHGVTPRDDGMIAARDVVALELGAALIAQAERGDQPLSDLKARFHLSDEETACVVELAGVAVPDGIVAAADMEQFERAATSYLESTECAIRRL